MDQVKSFVKDISERPQSVLLPAALFFLFAPGNYFLIPGPTSWIEMSQIAANRSLIASHAILFALALALAIRNFPQYC